MATEWTGVVNTTTQKFLRTVQDNTIRGRLWLAMLQKRNRLTFGESGTEMEWRVKFGHQVVESYGDGGVVDFARSDLFRVLSVDWRGYIVSDAMHKKERMMNRGNEAIVKRYARIIPDLKTSMTEKFGTELYNDGYASGNEDRLHGINSFTGTGTTVAADLIAQADDNYGGYDTDLGAEAGTWSDTVGFTAPNAAVGNDWPDGVGDAEYDWNTPLLVNWSSNAWGTSAQTWVANCERALRRSIIWQGQRCGEEGLPNLFMMSGNLYFDFLNLYSARNQQIVPYKEGQDLGFEGVVNLDGAGVYHEFGVTANEFYGLCMNKMKLRCMGDQLFEAEGPEFDMRTQSWLFSVGFFGNCEFNPKYFVKGKNFAT